MAHPLPMPRRILAGLRRLAPEARSVLVAVSGGSDSVALLRGLVDATRDGAGPRLVAAHLDHGLRSESAADAAWVLDLCRRLDLPCRYEAVRVGELAARRRRNVEEVGRTVRYEFLTRIAREEACDVVVTAHTRDDQAETVLLQLLRGSASTGGIPPRQGRVLRPLLDLSKGDLRQWLDEVGQEWREDVTNRDTSRDRSWIRHQLMPRLEARRPGAASRIARFGHLQRDQSAFLEHEARRRFGAGPVARAALAAAPVALQRQVLVRLIRDAGGEPDRLHVEALLEALADGGTLRRDLPGNVRVRMLPERVDVIEPVPSDGARAAREVRDADDLPRGLPAELLSEGPLWLRAWRAGDRIPLAGGSRKVADVLGEHGVPREERDAVRVLARGAEVVWIEGIAVAAGLDEATADPDLPFMRRALELADAAAEAGEWPVGAVVVRDGRIVGEGCNARESCDDPAAHAEIVAMRDAARREGDWRLEGAVLYVTLEPCPMCAGAVLTTRLERVVWGASNHRDGAFGTVADLGAAPWKRVPTLRGGVLAREARHRLERFVASRRSGDAAGG